MYRLSLLLLVLMLSLSSCHSYQMFTQDMVEQYNWNENDLKKIQFYASEDIVLRQIQTGKRSNIENGEVNVESKRLLFKKVQKGLCSFNRPKIK
jgi:uncharacterized lipoprotein YehR (DUF1307 family)